jgi:hypothetical protein
MTDDMTSGTKRARRDGPLCNAPRKRGAGLCTQPAGWGTPNAGSDGTPGFGPCKLHGGCLPNVVKSFGTRRIDAEARDAVRGIVIEDVTDPLKALARHAGEIVAVRDFLRGEVERLESIRYQAGAGEQLRAELAAYQAALRDTTAVLGMYARLNIDERLARITHRQAEIVVEALNAGLEAAGVTGEERGRARLAVAAALRKHAAKEPEVHESITGEVVRVNGNRP